MSRPLIAVTTSSRTGWRVYPLINLNLWITGGRGVRWGVGRVADLAGVDGLIIGGGDDIGPELYGGKLGVSARLDPKRDELERCLAEAALEQNIPVLGICRGSQMLNVALGGTLDQDAWTTFGPDRKITTILPKREICVEAATHLSLISGEQPMKVNALHSQAVDRLGQGLRVSARDTGGMVQAIERVRDPFALGVQWHPEHLFYAHRQRAIFRALVTAADAYRTDRNQTRAMRTEMA
ncbi:type 1 glutamine amidotransferase [Marivita sp. XM-24bin2]|mgnify:CR=1 FL=1|jgi:putative glutamine amidotransferase|uniref:gamma-glutamyl-gamma-aminobutyrate hydrolase family protein n=1 Tax=unclassified Marivita TaxID=2632480 RepID=UPI000D7AB3DD|nr:type 1 glutamine amidotransferase [Marivita sp. XM-24bin2]MCR9108865.1 type 1 glutamine amidotransferase [Paracoccaceae bacterium]PWL34921.1 MAG: gamma-glutamyl-gamma-aminobutyrate hydrolase [Marivita sp. XM-24bin2]